MKKYRKTDQEYIDDYDRYTIQRLKDLEKDSKTPIYISKDLESKKDWKSDDVLSKYNPTSFFFDTAVKRAQSREEIISRRKREDENKDRLLLLTPIPKNVRCNTCNSEMFEEGHVFKENDTLILFFFTCPNKHIPKKLVYPDGKREWIFPKDICKKCGSDEFVSKTEEKEKMLVFTDACKNCGDSSITELELPKPDPPIDEDERKKYCSDWKGRRTFQQDLEAVADLAKYLEESGKLKKKKEDYGIDKIERLNVPPLENRLSKVSEELGFIKFKFESTSTKGFVIVSFSAQDPSDRKEAESIKELSNGIKRSLLSTNWRIMSDGIDYRLGVLTGKLKAFESEEGLFKIAKEIMEDSKKE